MKGVNTKVKIGVDEFCLHCMEWREFDEEGRCRVCKHIIHKESKTSESEGYNRHESYDSSDSDYDS